MYSRRNVGTRGGAQSPELRAERVRFVECTTLNTHTVDMFTAPSTSTRTYTYLGTCIRTQTAYLTSTVLVLW